MAKKIYISGPMTGYPELNYPAFEDAMVRLQEAGYEVLSPHQAPVCANWEDYMRYDITLLMQADGVALLPNFSASRGAQIEFKLAQQLSIPCFSVDEWVMSTEGSYGR